MLCSLQSGGFVKPLNPYSGTQISVLISKATPPFHILGFQPWRHPSLTGTLTVYAKLVRKSCQLYFQIISRICLLLPASKASIFCASPRVSHLDEWWRISEAPLRWGRCCLCRASSGVFQIEEYLQGGERLEKRRVSLAVSNRVWSDLHTAHERREQTKRVESPACCPPLLSPLPPKVYSQHSSQVVPRPAQSNWFSISEFSIWTYHHAISPLTVPSSPPTHTTPSQGPLLLCEPQTASSWHFLSACLFFA